MGARKAYVNRELRWLSFNERVLMAAENDSIPLMEHVIASYVSHFDETGVRVNGKVQWAHTSSTEKVTLISTHPKRGVAGILAAGVLDRFPGLAVSDCWGSYFCKDFEGVTHATCGAHIDRELEGIIQNTKPEAGKRGKRRKGKARNLLERLQKLKDAVLRFFTDFRVPFSNNIAERSYRLSKLKQKVVGSYRSDQGGANFCRIFSIIDTVRKNGGNPFEALSRLFNNSFSLDFLS
jgi:hypothetical protein